MDFTTINPLWGLADTLTVHQAASLIAGFDPNSTRFNSDDAVWFENDNGQIKGDGIANVQTAFAALSNSIAVGTLRAKVVHESRLVTDTDFQILVDMHQINDFDDEIAVPGLDRLAESDERVVGSYFVKNDPCWAKSLVDRNDLIAWLESKGMRSGFFFPGEAGAPDYLDAKNLRFANKLAAAVRAWQAVTELNGKSPKQALMKWLREHAADFGLSDEEGKSNETGIEEVAKVANWLPSGGAAKTPG